MNSAFTVRVIITDLLLVIASSSALECARPGLVFGGQCYTIRLDARTWPAAESTCVSLNQHQVSMTTELIQKYTSEVLQRFGFLFFWAGATNSNPLWQWTSSRRILASQGCYRQDSLNELWKQLNSSANTPEQCISLCRRLDYGYAALQNGTSCSCGYSFNRSREATGCNVPCSGASNVSKWCGGRGVNSVYQVSGASGVWAADQPTLKGSCGVLDVRLEGSLANDDCSVNHGFICRLNNTGSSQCSRSNTPNMLHLDSLSCIYWSDQQQVNWTSANVKCQQLGGQLISLEDDVVRLTVLQWLAVISNDTFTLAWIGLQKAGWYWTAGGSMEYTNWASNEPRLNVNNVDQCLLINGSNGFKWQALPCTQVRSFLCRTGINSLQGDSSGQQQIAGSTSTLKVDTYNTVNAASEAERPPSSGPTSLASTTASTYLSSSSFLSNDSTRTTTQNNRVSITNQLNRSAVTSPINAENEQFGTTVNVQSQRATSLVSSRASLSSSVSLSIPTSPKTNFQNTSTSSTTVPTVNQSYQSTNLRNNSFVGTFSSTVAVGETVNRLTNASGQPAASSTSSYNSISNSMKTNSISNTTAPSQNTLTSTVVGNVSITITDFTSTPYQTNSRISDATLSVPTYASVNSPLRSGSSTSTTGDDGVRQSTLNQGTLSTPTRPSFDPSTTFFINGSSTSPRSDSRDSISSAASSSVNQNGQFSSTQTGSYSITQSSTAYSPSGFDSTNGLVVSSTVTATLPGLGNRTTASRLSNDSSTVSALSNATSRLASDRSTSTASFSSEIDSTNSLVVSSTITSSLPGLDNRTTASQLGNGSSTVSALSNATSRLASDRSTVSGSTTSNTGQAGAVASTTSVTRSLSTTVGNLNNPSTPLSLSSTTSGSLNVGSSVSTMSTVAQNNQLSTLQNSSTLNVSSSTAAVSLSIYSPTPTSGRNLILSKLSTLENLSTNSTMNNNSFSTTTVPSQTMLNTSVNELDNLFNGSSPTGYSSSSHISITRSALTPSAPVNSQFSSDASSIVISMISASANDSFSHNTLDIVALSTSAVRDFNSSTTALFSSPTQHGGEQSRFNSLSSSSLGNSTNSTAFSTPRQFSSSRTTSLPVLISFTASAEQSVATSNSTFLSTVLGNQPSYASYSSSSSSQQFNSMSSAQTTTMSGLDRPTVTPVLSALNTTTGSSSMNEVSQPQSRRSTLSSSYISNTGQKDAGESSMSMGITLSTSALRDLATTFTNTGDNNVRSSLSVPATNQIISTPTPLNNSISSRTISSIDQTSKPSTPISLTANLSSNSSTTFAQTQTTASSTAPTATPGKLATPSTIQYTFSGSTNRNSVTTTSVLTQTLNDAMGNVSITITDFSHDGNQTNKLTTASSTETPSAIVNSMSLSDQTMVGVTNTSSYNGVTSSTLSKNPSSITTVNVFDGSTTNYVNSTVQYSVQPTISSSSLLSSPSENTISTVSESSNEKGQISSSQTGSFSTNKSTTSSEPQTVRPVSGGQLPSSMTATLQPITIASTPYGQSSTTSSSNISTMFNFPSSFATATQPGHGVQSTSSQLSNANFTVSSMSEVNSQKASESSIVRSSSTSSTGQDGARASTALNGATLSISATQLFGTTSTDYNNISRSFVLSSSSPNSPTFSSLNNNNSSVSSTTIPMNNEYNSSQSESNDSSVSNYNLSTPVVTQAFNVSRTTADSGQLTTTSFPNNLLSSPTNITSFPNTTSSRQTLSTYSAVRNVSTTATGPTSIGYLTGSHISSTRSMVRSTASVDSQLPGDQKTPGYSNYSESDYNATRQSTLEKTTSSPANGNGVDWSTTSSDSNSTRVLGEQSSQRSSSSFLLSSQAAISHTSPLMGSRTSIDSSVESSSVGATVGRSLSSTTVTPPVHTPLPVPINQSSNASFLSTSPVPYQSSYTAVNGATTILTENSGQNRSPTTKSTQMNNTNFTVTTLSASNSQLPSGRNTVSNSTTKNADLADPTRRTVSQSELSNFTSTTRGFGTISTDFKNTSQYSENSLSQQMSSSSSQYGSNGSTSDTYSSAVGVDQSVERSTTQPAWSSETSTKFDHSSRTVSAKSISTTTTSDRIVSTFNTGNSVTTTRTESSLNGYPSSSEVNDGSTFSPSVSVRTESQLANDRSSSTNSNDSNGGSDGTTHQRSFSSVPDDLSSQNLSSPSGPRNNISRSINIGINTFTTPTVINHNQSSTVQTRGSSYTASSAEAARPSFNSPTAIPVQTTTLTLLDDQSQSLQRTSDPRSEEFSAPRFSSSGRVSSVRSTVESFSTVKSQSSSSSSNILSTLGLLERQSSSSSSLTSELPAMSSTAPAEQNSVFPSGGSVSSNGISSQYSANLIFTNRGVTTTAFNRHNRSGSSTITYVGSTMETQNITSSLSPNNATTGHEILSVTTTPLSSDVSRVTVSDTQQTTIDVKRMTASTTLSGGGSTTSSTPTDWQIGLYALLALALLALLIIALVLIARYCKSKCCPTQVGTGKWLDARPIAHVPNSGHQFTSQTSLQRHDEEQDIQSYFSAYPRTYIAVNNYSKA